MNNDLENQKATAIQLLLSFTVMVDNKADVINRVREITNARSTVDIEEITGRPFK